MKRNVVLAILVAAGVANADPRHVLVLRAEGNADAATRAKIEKQIASFARTSDASVEVGEISFSDASAAVGCTGSEAQCRDEVLQTLGVDEVVATTVTTAPGGDTKVFVRRIAKGTPTKEVMTTIPAGQAPDAKLSTDVGPMFGVIGAPPPPPDKPPPPPPPPVTKPAPVPPAKPVEHAPPPVLTAQPNDTVTAAPNGEITRSDEGHGDHRRLELAGLATGGGLALVGMILWIEAADTQSQIDNLPAPKSPKDFRVLTDLENQGDSYAALGNVCFIGGVALAAVSGYFYIRDRRAGHRGSQARIAPALFDHGGGISFTLGGAP